MEKIKLGASTIEVTKIGLGSINFGTKLEQKRNLKYLILLLIKNMPH